MSGAFRTLGRIARRFEKQSSWLWKRIRSVRLRWLVSGDAVDTMLYSLALERPSAFFIQVGSNDAGFGDPLRPFFSMTGWRGIMIEPVPAVYQRLVEKHGSRPRFTFENVAVSAHEGVRPFYSVDPTGIDQHSWVDQLGSFSRETIMSHKHLLPDLESRVRATSVECVTLKSICERNAVSNIDLLHVDTEGADLEVLQSYEWNGPLPGMILYEHKHLSEPDKADARTMLERFNYRILRRGDDTLGVNEKLLSSSVTIRRAWQIVQSSGDRLSS